VTAVALIQHGLLLLVFPPLIPGTIAKVKAWFAGRKGPPLLQPYYDIVRLLRKGAVYSRTTTWVFRAGPCIGLASVLLAGLLVPLAGQGSPFGFPGDVLAFAYLLGLGRFFTMAAALDTGSSFEGMGASREAAFSALAEPALFLALAIVCVPAHSVSFRQALGALPAPAWETLHPAYLAAAIALFIVLLAENSRVPVDDPNTHLELTMVHEVMVLDHSGPDLAFILYGGAIKLLIMSSLLVHLCLPMQRLGAYSAFGVFFAAELAIAILVGVVESTMARLRLPRVPQFLIGASVIAAIGVAAMFYRGSP
jgi:formate hydrogenlyase subunit 4